MKKSSGMRSIHKAFTLLELIFVIVVIGVLSAIIVSNTKTNKLYEAATQVISHIRYTQHLAMIDDRFDLDDPYWYKGRWQIIFGKSAYTGQKITYSIFSDKAKDRTGKPDVSEIAKDPYNDGKLLSGGYSGIFRTTDPRANKNMNLGLTYKIDDVVFKDGCAYGSSKRLSFDHLGRPIKRPLRKYKQSYMVNRLVESTCSIVLVSNEEGNVTILIEPETGYAHIK